MGESRVSLSVNGKGSIIEDHLTLVVFSLFSYLRPDNGILAWVRRARPFSPGAGSLEFGADVRVSLELWPGTSDHGIPDIVMVCRSAGKTQAFVIEAKYGAGKSQWGEDSAEQQKANEDNRDQLARYWNAMRKDAFSWVADWPRGLPAQSQSVVYLTPDFLMPRAELLASQQKAPEMRLYWLSWRDAWSVVEEYAEPNETEGLVLRDLKNLFERLDMAEFRRFSQPLAADLVDTIAVWRLGPSWDLGKIGQSILVSPMRWRFCSEEA